MYYSQEGNVVLPLTLANIDKEAQQRAQRFERGSLCVTRETSRHSSSTLHALWRHRCSSGIIRGASKVANSDLNTESRVLILTGCGKKFIPAPKIESNGSTKRNGEMTGPNSNFDSKTAANITRIPRRNVKNARDKADRSEIARCTLPG